MYRWKALLYSVQRYLTNDKEMTCVDEHCYTYKVVKTYLLLLNKNGPKLVE